MATPDVPPDWPAGEPPPTEEEIRQAKALADYLDGKPAPDLDPGLKEMSDILRVAAPHMRKEQRRQKWIRLAMVVSFPAAAMILVWLALPKPQPLPPAPAELIAQQTLAARAGNTEALERAMAPYRQTVKNAPASARTKERAFAKDAAFSQALIEIKRGDGETALNTIAQAFALGDEDDVFTLNLLLARAAAHRGLGHAKDEARALSEAMKLAERLLAESLR